MYKVCTRNKTPSKHSTHAQPPTHQQRVAQNRNCRGQHDNGENERANWIGQLPRWHKVDDQGGNKNANTLQHIANNVYECGAHVQVVAAAAVAVTSAAAAAVGMSVR